MNETSFRHELTSLLNRFSRENVSDTPDYLLADYMIRCLDAYEHITQARDAWHGFMPWGHDPRCSPAGTEFPEPDGPPVAPV